MDSNNTVDDNNHNDASHDNNDNNRNKNDNDNGKSENHKYNRDEIMIAIRTANLTTLFTIL